VDGSRVLAAIQAIRSAVSTWVPTLIEEPS
jgi:hypothetical protein